jgi:hypothetical protein
MDKPNMETEQMRVRTFDYEMVREEAFRTHRPMTEVLSEVIQFFFAAKK